MDEAKKFDRAWMDELSPTGRIRSVGDHAAQAMELGWELGPKMHLDIETRAADGEMQTVAYMNGLDREPIPARMTFPALLGDRHFSEMVSTSACTNNVGPDGSAIGPDVMVLAGGDYYHTEMRVLEHMSSEAFAEFCEKFNEVVDTYRTLELKRESLRDAMLVKASAYTVDSPRPDKPKRDWEKRNKKQRRR